MNPSFTMIISMTKQEFYQHYKLLLKQYSKPEDKAKASAYYQAFQDYPKGDFEIACKEVVIHQKFFPMIAEIFEHMPITKKKVRITEHKKKLVKRLEALQKKTLGEK